jgi:hypothetical protein
MIKNLLRFSILILIISNSCKKTDSSISIDSQNDANFIGTFKEIASETIYGTVSLYISDGYYYCFTNLPYGYGAGRLEVDETTIDFIDTLFFPIPAMYGPSYVLSGKYYYVFDGKDLKIWEIKNVYEIEYNLELTTN